MTGRKKSRKREGESVPSPSAVEGEERRENEEGGESSEPRPAEEELAECREEAEACRDRLLRLQAEFENYKKRQFREREERQRNARVSILKEFLPILDNLERAVEHGDETETGKLVEGVRLVLKQFREGITQFGVTRMDSMGGKFDPHVHQAMSRVETDGDPPDGTIVEVYQEGYLLEDKVLRPAMVGVAKMVDEQEEEEDA